MHKRDEAASSIYGKCVSLLARLDTMYFEGSLTSEENKMRDVLFELLIKRYKTLGENIKDYDNLLHEINDKLNGILESLKNVTSLVEEKNSNFFSKISRLSRVDEPLVTSGMSTEDLLKMRTSIKEVLAKKSEKAALNIYQMYPLNSFLIKHKKQVFIDLIEKFFTEKDTVDFRRKSFHRNYNNMIS